MDQDQSTFNSTIHWFQGALRNNTVQMSHYLTGLDGCGNNVEASIRKSFFRILERIICQIKHGKHDVAQREGQLAVLIEALLWDYRVEDRSELAKLQIFKTLLHGDGNRLHIVQQKWGGEFSLYGLGKDTQTNHEECCVSKRVRQAFEFLVKKVFEGVFVHKTQETLEIGAGSEQAATGMLQGGN